MRFFTLLIGGLIVSGGLVACSPSGSDRVDEAQTDMTSVRLLDRQLTAGYSLNLEQQMDVTALNGLDYDTLTEVEGRLIEIVKRSKNVLAIIQRGDNQMVETDKQKQWDFFNHVHDNAEYALREVTKSLRSLRNGEKPEPKKAATTPPPPAQDI